MGPSVFQKAGYAPNSKKQHWTTTSKAAKAYFPEVSIPRNRRLNSRWSRTRLIPSMRPRKTLLAREHVEICVQHGRRETECMIPRRALHTLQPLIILIVARLRALFLPAYRAHLGTPSLLRRLPRRL